MIFFLYETHFRFKYTTGMEKGYTMHTTVNEQDWLC